MQPKQRQRSGWAMFVTMTLLGLFFAFIIFAVLAMGECLPRDGSAATHACDVAKRRQMLMYPSLVLCIILAASWIFRKISDLGWLLALMSAIIAAVMLSIVEGVLSVTGLSMP